MNLEIKLHNNKQSVEENLIGRTVKTTIQIFVDKGLFDKYNFSNEHEVLKVFLLIERRRPALEESKLC